MAIANNPLIVRGNVSKTSKATRQMLDGQEHVVVPVTLIVQGLLNGIFYNSLELGKFAQAWNGVPVPVGHPKDENGQFVSANQPLYVETLNIGTIFNAKFEADKLTGEAWLNVEKATRLGFADIIANFDAGQEMEVSTGLFCDAFQASGVWANTPYNYEARNIRPDHLALLPNEKGACSIDDGCGAMRANSEAKDEAYKLTGNHLIVNEKSFEQIRAAVHGELKKSYLKTYPYIVEMYDAYAVYEVEQDSGSLKLYKIAYSIDAVSGAVSLGDSVEVVRETSYKQISANNIMCETKKEDNALSANEVAEYRELKAKEQKRTAALRESVGKIHPALTPEILANMSVAALEALNVPVVDPVPVVNAAPAADMSARGGVGVDANANNQPYVRPSVVMGEW